MTDWIENTGKMPVAGDVLVDVKIKNGSSVFFYKADEWLWGNCGKFTITHWRLHKTEEPKEPNASLIAAAPDLLETLQELIRRESECEEVLTIFMDAKIRAVIAKAQGVCR